MKGYEVLLVESRMHLVNLPQWESVYMLFSVGETQGTTTIILLSLSSVFD
jgi:hypothetical protein